jgi:purine-binding chemotaxis protein CheW
MAEQRSRIDLLLEEVRRNRQEREVVDVEEGQRKVVLVRCAGDRYAFRGEDIKEILGEQEISWMPGLPPFIPGLIRVRGDIESVVDIGHFLGTPGSGGYIAMAERGGFRTGIRVDGVDDVLDVPASALRPPLDTLSGAARDLVGGAVAWDGTLIPLLDLDRLAARVTL